MNIPYIHVQVHTVHLITKLMFYARRMGTGATCYGWACYGYEYWHCVGHIVRPKSKQDGGMVEPVSYVPVTYVLA